MNRIPLTWCNPGLGPENAPLIAEELRIRAKFYRGDHGGDVCRELRSRHPNVPAARLDPLFAIPPELLDAFAGLKSLSNWITPDELGFERDLTALCREHGAVGIVEDNLAFCGDFGSFQKGV